MLRVGTETGEPEQDPKKPKGQPAPFLKGPPKGVLGGRLPESDVDPLPFMNVIQLEDKRKVNPATGLPFKKTGTKGIKADEGLIKTIIAHAKASGVDPNDAIAYALQETNLGKTDMNIGHTLGYGSTTDEIKDLPLEYQGVPSFIKAIKDKSQYADELIKKKIIPDSEEYRIQAYNGYGKLFPHTEVQGKHPAGQQGLYTKENQAFYEIPISRENPLDLKKNPAYGKTVKQLRDEIIKTNPQIAKLIQDTPAYARKGDTSKPMLRVTQ